MHKLKFLVKTMDTGFVRRYYFSSFERAFSFFCSCGSASLYEYNADTFFYDLIDCR